MKTRIKITTLIFALGAMLIMFAYQCSSPRKTTGSSQAEKIITNLDGSGMLLKIDFQKGKSHNHPLMAIWLEDANGKYIETLYITESIGKGIFKHGEKSQGKWLAGEVRRPAALPYWGHKRGIQADDGLYLPTPEAPVPDAISGPTPKGNFTLQSKSSDPTPAVFKVLLEINQSWDWNWFWTNAKYLGDENYRTSSQPSVVYEAVIDLNSPLKDYVMKPSGHGHYSGADGSLNPDLSTLTTALEIAQSVTVSIITR